MPEDRSQAPSAQRRRLARESGLVARSPELTAAVGLLAAITLLGAFGGELAGALSSMIRTSLAEPLSPAADPGELVAHLRGLAFSLLRPMGGILLGVVAAAVAAHQAQVGGLFTPARLAPKLDRLWSPRGLSIGGAAWPTLKVAAVVAVSTWLILGELPTLARLSRLDTPGLALAAGALLRRLALSLATATVALGLVDYALQRARVESRLWMTPDQHRDDLHAVDGDPALRARRRKLAQDRRAGRADPLENASLALTGGGLIVVLSGGPPPRKFTVRATSRGATAARWRRDALARDLRVVESPDLARHLARGRVAAGPLPPELAAALIAAFG